MRTTKTLLIALCIFTATISAFGQNPVQNLKRTVVFTMNPGEKMNYNCCDYKNQGFSFAQDGNKNRFAALLEDTHENYTFVFNGTRIKLSSNKDVHDFDIFEDNAYVITYKENDRYYINYNGVIDGDFEDITVDKMGSYREYIKTKDGAYLITTEKDYDYLYKLAGRWYAHKNGKNKKINFATDYYKKNENGPYKKRNYYVNINGKTIGNHDGISALRLYENGNYSYRYEEDGKGYVNINGNIHGPYDKYYYDGWNPDVDKLTESGEYAYFYEKNKKSYVNISGKIEGPYDHVSHLRLYENGKYSYSYELNEKYYVNMNGKIGGPYDNFACYMCDYTYILTESGQYAYDYDINEKNYVNINGRINGPYHFAYLNSGDCSYPTSSGLCCGNDYSDALGSTFILTESGQYAFAYLENEKYFLNINGNKKGPYDYCGSDEMGACGCADYPRYYVKNFTLTESGQYAYRYTENGKDYVNINGSINGPYDGAYNLQFTESGKYFYGYTENRKYYVNINGNIHGPYDNAYSSKFTKSGTYFYGYTENGKNYVNINGSINGSYNSVCNLKFTQNGKYAYCYTENGKYYVNINGSIHGPYDKTFDNGLELSESGKYAYGYSENGKNYLNVNGKISSTDHSDYNFYTSYDNDEVNVKPANYPFVDFTYGGELNSKNNEHSFHSSSRYEHVEYVVIDGRRQGKSSAIEARYDEKKNAFIWLCIEDREFVMYEYKLD